MITRSQAWDFQDDQLRGTVSDVPNYPPCPNPSCGPASRFEDEREASGEELDTDGIHFPPSQEWRPHLLIMPDSPGPRDDYELRAEPREKY